MLYVCLYMQLAERSWAVPAVCGAGNSCPKETESLLRFLDIKAVKKNLPLSLCVNFSGASFCVSSRNHFTVAEFLMAIKVFSRRLAVSSTLLFFISLCILR